MKSEKKTQDKIIDSAIELFAKHSYEEVSILQICTNASVSNGIIYSYYKNKEYLLKSLMDETAERLNHQFEKITGTNVKERLKSFIKLNLEITEKEFSLIKVYREIQYKYVEYEQKLRLVYLNALETVYDRPLNKFEYLFIISGIRFINTSYIQRGLSLDIEFLTDILLEGFLKSENIEIEKLEESNFYITTLFDIENTKQKLLKNGEKLFGKKGYYKTKIKDIALETNVQIGGFYYYFENKEQFLRNIINNIKNEIIFFLQGNRNISYNAENHILFLYLLLEYFKKAPYKYKLIRDSEFFAEDVIHEFYKELETLYIECLNTLPYTENQKQIISSLLIGIAHYMGIEFFYTKNLQNKKEFLTQMKFFFENGLPS